MSPAPIGYVRSAPVYPRPRPVSRLRRWTGTGAHVYNGASESAPLEDGYEVWPAAPVRKPDGPQRKGDRRRAVRHHGARRGVRLRLRMAGRAPLQRVRILRLAGGHPGRPCHTHPEGPPRHRRRRPPPEPPPAGGGGLRNPGPAVRRPRRSRRRAWLPAPRVRRLRNRPGPLPRDIPRIRGDHSAGLDTGALLLPGAVLPGQRPVRAPETAAEAAPAHLDGLPFAGDVRAVRPLRVQPHVRAGIRL